jgi:hypothetical protein
MFMRANAMHDDFSPGRHPANKGKISTIILLCSCTDF